MMRRRMLAAAGNVGGIPTDGLIAHWTMDNVSGSTLIDEQGSYDGAISGAVQTAGLIGQALNFDGADRVAVSGATPLYTGAFCHSLWFFSTDNTRSIVTAGISRYDYGLRSWDLFGDGANLKFDLGDGSARTLRLETAYPALNAWHHALVQWDGTTSANSLEMYLDGILVDSGAPSSATVGTFEFALGGENTEGDFRLVGKIDQYRVYDAPQSAAAIDALYSEGA